MLIRRALWATAVINVFGALGFLFPESLGQNVGMPVPVSPFYTWYIALVVLIFAGVYTWLARQAVIDRPLLWVGAIGKAGFFAVCLASWVIGDLPARGVLLSSVDVVFAAIFVWWLTAGSRT